MGRVILRQSFVKDLEGLKQSSRKHYQRTCEVLVELDLGKKPAAHLRTESRIPKCIKYELPDGYRLVLQRTESDRELVALVVGKHDHVESFLDGHKGYVFDHQSGRVRDLHLATSNETAITIAPSSRLYSQIPSQPIADRVFRSLTPEMLTRMGVPDKFVKNLLDILSLIHI